MPHGLPRGCDRGLDGAADWGRVYWGGTIYSLIADIESRKRTNKRLELKDALRASVAEGATHDKLWRVQRALRAVDLQIGQVVLAELYERMGKRRYRLDLTRLWRQLGIRSSGRSTTFDDSAELADIHPAIMTARL